MEGFRDLAACWEPRPEVLDANYEAALTLVAVSLCQWSIL